MDSNHLKAANLAEKAYKASLTTESDAQERGFPFSYPDPDNAFGVRFG